MEMVSGHMAQMTYDKRYKNRMVKHETEDENPYYRIFPTVQRNNDLVSL